MELYEIAKRIEDKISLLERMRKEIRDRAEQKAISQAAYDKALAVCIIKLKNGQELELDGEKIQKPVQSIAEKIAKGICHGEKLEADKAEALYKSLISNIDSVKTEVNALQSINRYLDHT